MDGIDTTLNTIDLKQSTVDKFRTKVQAESFNKSIETNGRQPVKDLGKDEFLKLLITELKNQDPTNPMQDREFIAQMAQFSSLEQMLKFNTNMGKMMENQSFQSGFNLLGMNVDIDSQDRIDMNGEPLQVSGMVESITRKNNEIYVRVNGEDYPMSNVKAMRK
jgi:flagellar basal-body rod modification protein FlgD